MQHKQNVVVTVTTKTDNYPEQSKLWWLKTFNVVWFQLQVLFTSWLIILTKSHAIYWHQLLIYTQ